MKQSKYLANHFSAARTVTYYKLKYSRYGNSNLKFYFKW